MTNSRKGFSLIELLIVIGIVGILALVATPAVLRHATNSNLKSAVRDMAADFPYLKEKTITEGIQYRIVFNTGAKNYTIQKGTAAGAPWTTLQTKSVTSFGSDIHFTANTSTTTYTFQTRGTVTPTGTVELANSRGSTTTLKVNIAGRTYVQYSMQ